MSSPENFESFKCVSLNVRGLNDTAKRIKVFKWLKENEADIIFLQETYCVTNFIPYFNSNWRGKVFHACTDSKHSRGVSIMFNERFHVTISNIHQSQDGRRLIVNGIYKEKSVSFVCIYAPNEEKSRKDFFVRTKKWISRYVNNESNIICAGDFNCCLRDEDRSSKTHLKDKSRNSMSILLQELNIIDTWNNEGSRYTYIDNRTGTKSRLDYILVSKDCDLVIQNTLISLCPFVPDHSCVVAVLNILTKQRGKGYWKMNSNLLNDKVYIKMIIETINATKNTYKNCCKKTIWELIKAKVKEVSINYSKIKCKSTRNKKTFIQSNLDEICNLINNGCKSGDLVNKKLHLENQLDEIYHNEIKGAQIRSKVRWAEEGEKSSKYFLSLEKKHQIVNTITQLKIENGRVITNDIDILNECTNFYKALYSTKNINDKNVADYIKSTNVPKLDLSSKTDCDNDITESEVYQAVMKLKQNKSPGLDGIIPEFYKTLWEHIKEPYMDMLKETLYTEHMPPSMCQSVISLIFKKGDKDNLQNYRPISLSNYDYKIVAFVLAKRIQNVISKLIHKDQTGYIKGRFIGQNSRLINDIFEYCEEYCVPGAIICIDFEKAFDTLEWNFMHETLNHFNFGRTFLKWIKILYSNPTIIVKNNGWLSECIRMERGIRQGCPVSALLFILSIEIMSNRIRNNSQITGFTYNTIEHKLSQYADDTTLLLSKIDAIKESFYEINTFCNHSGLKINLSKTEGIWLGSYKDYPSFFEGIKFTKNAVRCLGIYIGHDKNECFTGNWLTKISKLKTCLHVWKSRKLTLYGKITILKCLGMSKFIYTFSVLKVPTEIVKQINKIFYNFIWNKNDRIKRTTLINEYEKGGMRMVDVESMIESLKAAWIPRLLCCTHTSSFLSDQLNKYNMNIKMLLDGNITHESFLQKVLFLNSFYIDCIISFNRCKTDVELTKMRVNDFLAQPIFCNKLFVHKGKALLFKHWISSGLCFVKDLYDENGLFLEDGIIFDKLQDRRNWIAELLLIRQIVGKCVKKKCENCTQDLSLARHININDKVTSLVINNKRYNVENQKSKFFYKAIVQRKSRRSYVEKVWEKELSMNLSYDDWASIYINRIHKIPIKKLSEFMYKVINRLTVSRQILKSWKQISDDKCPFCKKLETVKHIYFECDRVGNMWKHLGNALKIDITWKKILFGYTQDIQSHKVRNLLFSIVMYSLFKHWINSFENSIQYTQVNLIMSVKMELRKQTYYFKYCSAMNLDGFNSAWENIVKSVEKM